MRNSDTAAEVVICIFFNKFFTFSAYFVAHDAIKNKQVKLYINIRLRMRSSFSATNYMLPAFRPNFVEGAFSA